ncbi:alpha/beta hydrolase [Arthrobacter sp. MYb213]|uniref:alpha/beta hydrolase n=1 Tax=Arthrobacter sp. MYb213 TaxID=1848595 RepID=UPI0011B0C644|nr:alpha/beta hydrolase [Arthrobacter sp. MYb213]
MALRTRNIEKYRLNGVRTFTTIEALLASPIRPGLNSVKSNNRFFDFFFEDRGSNVTLVAFHAALGTKTEHYPIFSGHNFAKELGVNLLSFADPACGGAESMLTFWHQSTKRVDSSAFIVDIVKNIVNSSSGRNLIFFGSSAGGFAALRYSALFAGSVCVVMNPRIELESKPYRFDSYSRRAFPGWLPEQVAKRFPTSMSNYYSIPRKNKVFYLQNSNDELYFNFHFMPFKVATKSRDNIQFKIENWGKGHVVPPKNEYMDLLKQLVSSAPNWSSRPDGFINGGMIDNDGSQHTPSKSVAVIHQEIERIHSQINDIDKKSVAPELRQILQVAYSDLEMLIKDLA